MLVGLEEKGDLFPVSLQVNMDKLKERAQRFGLNVSSLSKKVSPGHSAPPEHPEVLLEVLHLLSQC